MGTTRLTNRHQQAPTGTERTAKLVFEIHGLVVDFILTAKVPNRPTCRRLGLVAALADWLREDLFPTESVHDDEEGVEQTEVIGYTHAAKSTSVGGNGEKCRHVEI